jgi:hypothetical protein
VWLVADGEYTPWPRASQNLVADEDHVADWGVDEDSKAHGLIGLLVDPQYPNLPDDTFVCRGCRGKPGP